MSKPERGSLTTLLAKKPLGQGAPAAVPLEQAETAVFGRDENTAAHEAVQPVVHTPVRTAGPPEVPPTQLLNRPHKRTVRVPWTFKMPFDLREELEAVARFNDLNMTEIAVEAIERHLKHFPHPPDKPGRAGESG